MTKPYIVAFKRDSWRQFEKLDRIVIETILKHLLALARNADTVPLYALKGQWKGLFRIRIGDYRVIYQLDADERLITVIAVGHRREIYDE